MPLWDDQAEKALRIFKRLRIPDQIGMPTYGELCDDWVFDLVRTIFGCLNPETKRRMIREFFLLIPKKNGKSSIAAAIIVVAAIMNERPEAELLLIAPTMTIAKIAFKQAWGIIRADPELDKRFHVREHLRTITHLVSRAEIAIKAADSDVITGGKAAYTLIDETHEFARKSNADAVFLELRGALASRPEGFLMQISTQSKDQPTGVFEQELTMARDVRDGRVQLPVLAVLYELPKKMAKDWQNPETWPLVNPNLGRSVDEQFLRDALVAAQEKGPAALALFASQHFNVEIGVGMKVKSWIGGQFWEKAADKSLTLDEILRRSEVIVAGIDGGGLDDLLALALIGRCRETDDWLGWCHAWAHPEVFGRKEIASRLHMFAEDGDLTIVDAAHPTSDLEQLADYIEKIVQSGLFPDSRAIGLDTHAVAAITDELSARGVQEDQLTLVPQGPSLSPAIYGMERKLKDRTFRHNGSRLGNWCVGNAKAELKGSRTQITKETAGKAKIDPLIAYFDAFQLMARNPVAGGMGVISVPENYRVA